MNVDQRLYLLVEGSWGKANELNAGNKARNDVTDILAERGVAQIKIDFSSIHNTSNVASKVGNYIRIYKLLKSGLSSLPDNSILIIQFPMISHTPFLGQIIRRLHKRGIKIVLLIHDLEMIRSSLDKKTKLTTKIRVLQEEKGALDLSDAIIAHNDAMGSYIRERFSISHEKVISLEIFDYLTSSDTPSCKNTSRSAPIVFAGNLSRNKSAFIYEFPPDVHLRLHGSGYEAAGDFHIDYQGSCLPERLPSILDGSFGLVWDGPDVNTCAGAFGGYLRFNNPHKTSLYLAAGLPILIWDQAALAPFILERGAGLAIGSLKDIRGALDSLSEEEYIEMRKCAGLLGEELRNGKNTERALDSVRMLFDVEDDSTEGHNA